MNKMNIKCVGLHVMVRNDVGIIMFGCGDMGYHPVHGCRGAIREPTRFPGVAPRATNNGTPGGVLLCFVNCVGCNGVLLIDWD